MQKITKFMNLFKGRNDAWGKLIKDGSLRCIHSEVTNTMFEQHLAGVAPLAIYPLLDEGSANKVGQVSYSLFFHKLLYSL